MSNSFFKLNDEEKDILEKISSISTRDKTIVKDVFKALLKTIVYKLYMDDNEIHIPYIGSLKIEYHDKLVHDHVEVVTDLTCTPSESLMAEIRAISEGNITPTKEYIKKRITKKFEELLEIED